MARSGGAISAHENRADRGAGMNRSPRSVGPMDFSPSPRAAELVSLVADFVSNEIEPVHRGVMVRREISKHQS